jgi:hypothetical protein
MKEISARLQAEEEKAASEVVEDSGTILMFNTRSYPAESSEEQPLAKKKGQVKKTATRSNHPRSPFTRDRCSHLYRRGSKNAKRKQTSEPDQRPPQKKPR